MLFKQKHLKEKQVPVRKNKNLLVVKVSHRIIGSRTVTASVSMSYQSKKLIPCLLTKCSLCSTRYKCQVL